MVGLRNGTDKTFNEMDYFPGEKKKKQLVPVHAPPPPPKKLVPRWLEYKYFHEFTQWCLGSSV